VFAEAPAVTRLAVDTVNSIPLMAKQEKARCLLNVVNDEEL